MRYFMKVLELSILCIALCTKGSYSVKTVNAEMTDVDYVAYYESILESDAWQSEIDHSVCVEMLQLPEEMIKAMNTDMLVDAVLSYPYFMDIYAFDSIEMGVNILFESFNGLRALEQREDAADVLLRKYKGFEVLSASGAEALDSTAVGDKLFALSNLEVLLAQDFVTQRLDDAGQRELGEEVARKYDEKKECGRSAFTLDTFYRVIEEVCEDEEMYNQVARSSKVVYTPNKTEVEVIARGEIYTADEIEQMDEYMDSRYPKATRIAPSTSKYNCHSYAWYWQSDSNFYWMDNPSAYWTDGSYQNVSVPEVGDKMIWVTNNLVKHSAVITNRLEGPIGLYDGYTGLTIVTSKWGNYGLYVHNGKYCPYWISNTYTTYYE